MKKALLLSAVLLFAVTSFADTIINNFNGYNDTWAPFGDPATATQTYGEIFTAPNGINDLTTFSFYMGNQYSVFGGNIITGAYIATWTGTHAGQLLFSSPEINYDNLGNEEITVSTNNVIVTPGQQYIAFLSTSQYHGQSMGEAYASAGSADPNLNGFAYFNNGRAFDDLFALPWDGFGLSPDWAVNLEFTSIPEPSTLVFLGTGILSGLGMLRRKSF
ncbi:MAG: PEP-CTERM sorting domain-containing protein [Candidatus Korobacteraceae bacterium]